MAAPYWQILHTTGDESIWSKLTHDPHHFCDALEQQCVRYMRSLTRSRKNEGAGLELASRAFVEQTCNQREVCLIV